MKLRLADLESRSYKHIDTAGYPCLLCGREVNEAKAKNREVLASFVEAGKDVAR